MSEWIYYNDVLYERYEIINNYFNQSPFCFARAIAG